MLGFWCTQIHEVQTDDTYQNKVYQDPLSWVLCRIGFRLTFVGVAPSPNSCNHLEQESVTHINEAAKMVGNYQPVDPLPLH